MASIIPYDNNTSSTYSPLASWINAWDDALGIPASIVSRSAMQMDVEEKPDAYSVRVTVPGVARDQIDVELNNHNLSITVDKKDSDDESKKNYIRRETSEYHATRSVYLKDADTKGLTATLKDGVLEVNVPKVQGSEGTKVEIQ